MLAILKRSVLDHKETSTQAREQTSITSVSFQKRLQLWIAASKFNMGSKKLQASVNQRKHGIQDLTISDNRVAASCQLQACQHGLD